MRVRVTLVAGLAMLLPMIEAASADDPTISEKLLRKAVEVNATPAEVFDAWTTPTGIARFFAPGCKIELEPGGAYEIYFMPDAPAGQRGAEGSAVLSYIPNEMLAFSWGAPPSIPRLREAGAMSQVVLCFAPLAEGRTRVELTQHGFGEGEDWDQYYAYFDKAWERVLDRLRASFEGRATAPAQAAAPKTRTWADGHVRVSAQDAPVKRQDFEIVIPVGVQKVWNALATTEGLRSLGGNDALVELKPGGRYAFWPQAPNRVMAFIPMQMLSTSGSAPPKFPNVRKGGTWSAYFFEPLDTDRTRLRLVVVGWKAGEEWDEAYEYFLKNNALFLNRVYEKIVGGK